MDDYIKKLQYNLVNVKKYDGTIFKNEQVRFKFGYLPSYMHGCAETGLRVRLNKVVL